MCERDRERNSHKCSGLFCCVQATRPDMIRILSAALHVVLRRDMSLNRRLYAWLLGAKYTHRHCTHVLMYQGSNSPCYFWNIVFREILSPQDKIREFSFGDVQECQGTLYRNMPKSVVTVVGFTHLWTCSRHFTVHSITQQEKAFIFIGHETTLTYSYRHFTRTMAGTNLYIHIVLFCDLCRPVVYMCFVAVFHFFFFFCSVERTVDLLSAVVIVLLYVLLFATHCGWTCW